MAPGNQSSTETRCSYYWGKGQLALEMWTGEVRVKVLYSPEYREGVKRETPWDRMRSWRYSHAAEKACHHVACIAEDHLYVDVVCGAGNLSQVSCLPQVDANLRMR